MTSLAKQQAQTFDDICYAAFATHFKVVLRSKIRPGEEPDDAARREWNDNLPGVALCWHGLVQGMLINVVEAQKSGALPAILDVKPAPLDGLGGHPLPGAPEPAKQPEGLASRLARQMRERQDAAAARSPARPYLADPAPLPPHTQAQAGQPLDVSPGLAIGRDTETPAPEPAPQSDPGYSGDGGSSGGGGASGDY